MAPKPAYRIATMSEIRATAWNGLTVVSTFAGGGGSSTGYRMAGYRVLAAVEFVPSAGDTYAANKAPYTRLLRRDVRQLTSTEILAATGVAPGELDVLDGSPPCEPFSSAGQREASWRDERAYSGQVQRTDDLFFEYARLVGEIRPRVFVAENVAGLVRGRAKGYFKMIMAELRACGYRVQARVLDAARLGVPQHRQRVIIMGVREDLGRDPAWPVPLPYVFTVRDALPHIARIGTDPNFDRRRADSMTQDDMLVDADRPAPTQRTRARPSDKLAASGASGMVETRSGDNFAPSASGLDDPSPTIMARGGSAGESSRGTFVVEPGVYQDSRGSHRMPDGSVADRPLPTVTGSKNATDFQVVEPGFYRDTGGLHGGDPDRNRIDEPSPAITVGGVGHGGGSSASHYEVGEGGPTRRKLTIPELVRLSGFPDDYVLVGTFGQRWERLGDCVPPPMAAAWAAAIRDRILT